jgi:glycosyltransferase involved in cell wall biosynthesis
MRLLIVMPISSPWARNFAQQIINSGNEVYVVDLSPINHLTYLQSPNNFQKEDIAKFLQIVVGYRKNSLKRISPGWIARGVMIIRETANMFRPDILLTLYGGLWGFVSYLSRIKPLVVYIVGSDILVSNQIKRIITKKVLNESSLVFSNGIHLRQEAIKIAPKANIINLYLGIDTDKFSSQGDKSTNPIVILCSRGFKKIYNNKYLIEGLKELSPSIIERIKIVFTSAGPQLDEVKNYALATLNKSIHEKVEFLGGISEKQLLKILQSSNIYISLSFSDGASVSLMEALSCGLFPVLSDIPANREWIRDDNGILVPLDKPKILAQGITRAVLSNEWRSTTEQNNRGMIVAKANSLQNTKQFLSKVGELVNHY